jgi:hypothetical protein
MREIGVYSTNDIRRLEDMEPVGPDGDKLLVPMNMTTLDRVGKDRPKEDLAPAGESSKKSSRDGNPDEPENDGSSAAARRAMAPLRPVVEDAVGRMIRREASRARDGLRRFNGDSAGLRGWLDEFAGEHQARAETMLLPVARSLAGLVQGSMPDDGTAFMVKNFVATHLDEFRRLVGSGKAAGLDRWEIEQAPKLAGDLMDRVIGIKREAA